jgi:hypothetical protein
MLGIFIGESGEHPLGQRRVVDASSKNVTPKLLMMTSQAPDLCPKRLADAALVLLQRWPCRGKLASAN